MESLRAGCDRFNDIIAATPIGRLFRLEGSGHDEEIKNAKFLTEIRAGVTTFFTMAYIISVNAAILSASGGTCVCDGPDLCVADPAYNQCKREVQRDLVTATAAIACLGSVLFGLFTNLPVALAPGMGMNAYFAYQVVGFNGSGPVPYRLALAAVFIEGFIFIFLSLIGMRQWLVRLLPNSLKIASACGIGLFLSLIGLSYSAGIGAITGDIATPLALAGCTAEYKDENGFCTSHKLTNPTLWIGVMAGGILTAYLMAYRVKSAILIGILVVSAFSWPRGTSFTYFPYTVDGDGMFDFFKQVVAFHPIKHTLNVIDWDLTKAGGQFALAMFTLLYVDIIDCTATLYSMARYSGVVDPQTGDFPRSTIAYCTDAFTITIGSLFGTSPATAYIESGAGIAEGGKTGLTAIITGLCFFVSIFFAPIFASIPPWATGCTLIIVGATMMRQITSINWSYIGDVLPAFVTLMFIPFSYSVAYGVIAGIMTYVALNGLIYITKLITMGHIAPPDEELREYWTYKPQGGSLPLFLCFCKDLKDSVKGRGREDRRPESKGSQEAFADRKEASGHVIEMDETRTAVPMPAYNNKIYN